MTTLVLGANTAITGTTAKVTISNTTMNIGQTVGMMWLPLDDKRQAKISPAYLHETKDWASVDNATWTLDLAKVFGEHQVHRLQLVIYAYYDPSLALPATELAPFDLNH